MSIDQESNLVRYLYGIGFEVFVVRLHSKYSQFIFKKIKRLTKLDHSQRDLLKNFKPLM